MANDAENKFLTAQIASKRAIIEAMENSTNNNPNELENQRRILKGLLLEKEEREKNLYGWRKAVQTAMHHSALEKEGF